MSFNPKLKSETKLHSQVSCLKDEVEALKLQLKKVQYQLDKKEDDAERRDKAFRKAIATHFRQKNVQIVSLINLRADREPNKVQTLVPPTTNQAKPEYKKITVYYKSTFYYVLFTSIYFKYNTLRTSVLVLCVAFAIYLLLLQYRWIRI